MKIQLYTISKPSYKTPLESHYEKLCKGLGVEILWRHIFPTSVANAQKQGRESAQESYTQALSPFLLPHRESNIALHPEGLSVDSHSFSKLFGRGARLAIFIGGAYGFGEGFLKHTTAISLSPLTFSHTIVGTIVLEQIYRACSLLANHPYHK